MKRFKMNQIIFRNFYVYLKGNILLVLLIVIIITPSKLSARRDCLQQAERNVLERYDRPNKETFAISPSGHFYIHYDTTGSSAVTPDYVDEVE